MIVGQKKHICTLPQEPDYLSVSPAASQWKKITYCLKRLTLPAEWHYKTKIYLGSRLALLEERKRQITTAGYFIIHPYSALTFGFSVFYLIVQTADLLYVPFLVYLSCPSKDNPFIIFCDILAFCDIVGSFLTGYQCFLSKHVVLTNKEIAIHYLKTGFFVDFLAMMPLQTIDFFEDCSHPARTLLYVFNLLRFRSMTAKWEDLYSQLRMSHFTTVIVSVLAKVTFFMHWMAYIYYQIPSFIVHLKDENWYGKAWFNSTRVTSGDTLIVKYTASLYSVFCLCVGTGYLERISEHVVEALLLETLVTLVGLFFIGYNFLALLRIAIYKTYQECIHEGRLKELEEYMIYKKLPQYLQRNVKLFIKYKFDGSYYNEQLIYATINEKIKNDISMYCCENLVKNVKMFQDLPAPLLNTFTFNLEHYLFMPGEVVTKAGTSAESLYLIASGTVAVISDSGKLLMHYREGTNFGQEALLHPGKYKNKTYIAMEVTEIYVLHYTKFLSCLQPYPHLRRRIESQKTSVSGDAHEY